jgi:hypothetical protein
MACPPRHNRSNAFRSKPVLDEPRTPSRYPDMFCMLAFPSSISHPGNGVEGRMVNETGRRTNTQKQD